MNTTIETKRKLIDVPTETLRLLSIRAAMKGTNVKNLIEQMLVSEAEKIDSIADANIYASMLINDPDGKVFLNEDETRDFEKRLGL